MKHPASMTPDQRDEYRALLAGTKRQKRELGHGLVVYCADDRPAAMAFAGKAIKPAWNYLFSNDAQREAHIAEWAAGQQRQTEAAAARKADKAKPHSLKVGDILHSQWGYEQTNNDYYQVTKVIGARMVEIREIANNYRASGFMSGTSQPVPGKFIGEPMRKIVNGGRVRIESFATAGLWNGRPCHESHYA